MIRGIPSSMSSPSSRRRPDQLGSGDGAEELARRAAAEVTLTNRPAVELFPCKDRRSLKKRRPFAERGRNARVIDEVAHESFDALTLKNEDDGLFRKKDAVSLKARQSKSVRRPFGDDLGGSFA